MYSIHRLTEFKYNFKNKAMQLRNHLIPQCYFLNI